ncbi:MAG: glycoside hydrolase family 88 protein [Planctomycetaceae bacterium]
MPTHKPLAVFLLLAGSAFAAHKPTDHNAAVEKALEKTKKWPGVIKSYIGVTRLGTRIPCLVTKDDVDYGTKKTRVLLLSGLFGSNKTVAFTLAQMEWFYTSPKAANLRKRFALSVVPIANPDAWATGKGPDNLSGGKPWKTYPPQGPFYSTKTDPEAAYLWRWIGMHAPDVVFNAAASLKRLRGITGPKSAVAGWLTVELPRIKAAGVGKIFATNTALGLGVPKADHERRTGHSLQTMFEAIDLMLKEGESPTVRLPSQARKELQRRIARTPTRIARQLSRKYGHNLNSVAYIPALALIGRMRLGELTGKPSHRKDVATIVAPYFTGKKKTFGRRIGGSHLSGHLVFGELARTEKDPAKRKRYVELARRAADLGFNDDGKPKPAMPYHNKMSDAVFMGCPILTQVGRLTGETKYYDMALRHMRFMLKLNLRKDGLHRHSPLHETAWGRGNGFPALGLVLCLSDLPKDHPGRKEMLTAFRNHVAAMAKHQDYTGAWHQVVDRPESYRELTVTCMTTFAMIRGIRNGWLDEKTYAPIVQRAWTAIKTRIAPDGTLVDVCTGTGKQKSLRAYYDRTAILGHDPRGGAMALLVTTEMAAWQKRRK